MALVNINTIMIRYIIHFYASVHRCIKFIIFFASAKTTNLMRISPYHTNADISLCISCSGLQIMKLTATSMPAKFLMEQIEVWLQRNSPQFSWISMCAKNFKRTPYFCHIYIFLYLYLPIKLRIRNSLKWESVRALLFLN